jgi:mannose-6-phosphate isomerase-like protein (cupin superfamily)
VFKIINLSDAPSIPMDGNRGMKKRLVDAALGTQALDVHMNTLAPGGARGKLHKHSVADNVYIVRSGNGEFVVEGKVYPVTKDQVVFIPAGMRHSLSNVSDEPFEIFEIYAPAGGKFDFIICE